MPIKKATKITGTVPNTKENWDRNFGMTIYPLSS